MLSRVTLGWALTLSGHTLWTLAEGGTSHPCPGAGCWPLRGLSGHVRGVGVCPTVLGAPG